MGSLYEKIKHGNGNQAVEGTPSLQPQTSFDRSDLSSQEAEAFAAYLQTENGKNYASWEKRALAYLNQVDQLEAEFQKGYRADLADATSHLAKFRGALNAQGKPAVIKYNYLLWALAIAAPFALAFLATLALPLVFGGESGSAMALQSTQLFMFAIPLAIVAAIAYPLTRNFFIKRKALKALRRTGLNVEGSSKTISYHRSTYGFFFKQGAADAMTDQEFISKVYAGQIDLDNASSRTFYDEAENLPGKIRDFIKQAPQTQPTDFPALDAPQTTNAKKFPNDSESKDFLTSYQDNQELQRQLGSY